MQWTNISKVCSTDLLLCLFQWITFIQYPIHASELENYRICQILVFINLDFILNKLWNIDSIHHFIESNVISSSYKIVKNHIINYVSQEFFTDMKAYQSFNSCTEMAFLCSWVSLTERYYCSLLMSFCKRAYFSSKFVAFDTTFLRSNYKL